MEGGTERSIFVSHVHEDRAVAAWLQKQLVDDFLGGVDVFVSSERAGHAGEDWLKAIAEALQRCRVLVALCSPVSINRPWVNFELGAAWMLEKTIIPACLAGLTPEDLKSPLSSLQGVTLSDAEDLESLYKTLATQLGFGRVPGRDFADLASKVPAVEAAAGQGDEGGSMELQMVDRDRDIRRRLRQALEKGNSWRTVGRLAVEAAVSEDKVLDILRADEQVEFTTRRADGAVLAGLTDRVRS